MTDNCNCKLDLDSEPTYEEAASIAEHIRAKCPVALRKPTIGLVLGSGYGPVAEAIEQPVAIPYSELKGFPVSTVVGHKGQFVMGILQGKSVVCMQGRFHLYEGHAIARCTLPIRVMHHLGVTTLLLTNAAGGVNQDYAIGDLMFLKDHIFCPGFSGNNPLRGLNDDRYGPRFPSMINLYDRELRLKALAVAKSMDLDFGVHEGVYTMFGGPSYETVAELKICRAYGTDAVGMSTCHEAIVGRHCGMKMLGLSLITNKCCLDPDKDMDVSHKEVLDVGKQRSGIASELIKRIVNQL